MIIGIDAREGVKVNRAGKGEYAYQLVGHIIKHSSHQFVLFLDTDLPNEWRGENVRGVVFRTNALLWQVAVFWYLELLRPVDVYLSTTSAILPALLRSVPVVMAVMDFITFLFPDQHQRKAVILEKIWLRPALRYARKLIAISEHTKQDAVRLFVVDPDKIIVVPLAPSFSPQSVDYPLPDAPIILHIGTLEPRKNLVRLVAAFNQIKSAIPKALLVLVGRWGWHNENIRQAIADSPFRSDIRVLETVSNEQKKSVYQQAAVLAFPSLYEGFGLPPLEAMAVGTPVVAARTSSVPAVVGEAAILIDPLSVEEIAQGIQRVLQDPQLAADLRTRGLAQAAKFNWETTAEQTLQVLLAVKK